MVGRIVEEWSGRREDIMFVDIGEPVMGSPRRAPLSFGDKVKVVAGVQKCVQRFLALLLTRRGSAIRQDLGSELLTWVMDQRVRTEVQLRNVFSLSVTQVVGDVNAQALRPDERLANVVLTGVLVERTRIVMKMRLTTEAGFSADFLAPIAR